MAGHSRARFDVWTDAGRKQGDEYLIAENVSPSQAFTMQRWLRLDGWGARTAPTAYVFPGERRRA